MDESSLAFSGLTPHIDAQLTALGIEDETFLEYILQILSDAEMQGEEKIEIIHEFLSSAREDEGEGQDILAVVEAMVVSATTILEDEESRREQEKTLTTSHTPHTPHTTASSLPSTAARPGLKEQRNAKLASMTREERVERERLLSRYGYEVEDVEEGENGESEIVFKDKSAIKQPEIVNISAMNAAAVRDKETAKKNEMAKKHGEDTARNKSDLEKQRLAKELKKKGSAKREKVRK